MEQITAHADFTHTALQRGVCRGLQRVGQIQ